MKIIGLRIEKYIGQNIDDHNFTYHDEEFEKHILCGILSDERKVEITLTEEYGECGSGWTTASWGDIEVLEVNKFNGYTHRPIRDLVIDDIGINYQNDYIDNEVFNFSFDGGDSYYPSGYYSVNMELFKPTARYKEKRPVWIFKGDSNLGKSFIAAKLNDLTIYETDSSNELPEKITESVIVLGNKYTHRLEEIKSRIFGDYDIVLVDFSTDHIPSI